MISRQGKEFPGEIFSLDSLAELDQKVLVLTASLLDVQHKKGIV